MRKVSNETEVSFETFLYVIFKAISYDCDMAIVDYA